MTRLPLRLFLVVASLALSALALSPGLAAAAPVTYAPQPDRNAEWAGPGQTPYVPHQIATVAGHYGLEIIPKFADDFNLPAHFAAAKAMVQAADRQGRTIRVFDYYNSAFWYTKNIAGWGSYANGFSDTWYAHDAAGHPIPAYAQGAGRTATPIGYVLDLTNPDYRAWAIANVTSWMRAAPYSGIALDSADVLLGQQTRFDRTRTNNDLFCGPGAAVDSAGNCAGVAAWNSGLQSLIQGMGAALHPLGDQVLYNGIAPNLTARGPSRNLGLLAVADMTSNENFCMTATKRGVTAQSITDELPILQRIARQHKDVLEITNFDSAALEQQWGEYCAAAFLTVYQPGSTMQIAHIGYADLLNGPQPVTPERELALGAPLTQPVVKGALLQRRFQNGVVVANSGTTPVTFRVPVSAERYANGKAISALRQGAVVRLAARGSAFMLTDAYLHPTAPTGTRSGLTGGQRLRSGEQLVSGAYQLTMRPTGNLVETGPHGAVIWTSTSTGTGATAGLDASGRLDVVSVTGAVLWTSGVAAPGSPALHLQPNGDLVVVSGSSVVWRSVQSGASSLRAAQVLYPGQSLTAGPTQLRLDPGGILTLRVSGAVVWHTSRSSALGPRLSVSPSGDLREITARGSVLWDTATSGPNAHLDVTGTGAAQLVSGTQILWSTTDRELHPGSTAPLTLVASGALLTPAPLTASRSDVTLAAGNYALTVALAAAAPAPGSPGSYGPTSRTTATVAIPAGAFDWTCQVVPVAGQVATVRVRCDLRDPRTKTDLVVTSGPEHPDPLIPWTLTGTVTRTS